MKAVLVIELESLLNNNDTLFEDDIFNVYP